MDVDEDEDFYAPDDSLQGASLQSKDEATPAQPDQADEDLEEGEEEDEADSDDSDSVGIESWSSNAMNWQYTIGYWYYYWKKGWF